MKTIFGTILDGLADLILRALAALWFAFDRIMERLFPVLARVVAVLIALVVCFHFQPAPKPTATVPAQAAPAAAPAPPAGYEMKGGQMVPIPAAG